LLYVCLFISYLTFLFRTQSFAPPPSYHFERVRKITLLKLHECNAINEPKASLESGNKWKRLHVLLMDSNHGVWRNLTTSFSGKNAVSQLKAKVISILETSANYVRGGNDPIANDAVIKEFASLHIVHKAVVAAHDEAAAEAKAKKAAFQATLND
jgi:hypothetical protein